MKHEGEEQRERDEHAGEGLLERVVPALRRLFDADPGRDADPLASALGFLRRGLVGVALPRALGRGPKLTTCRTFAHGVAIT